MALHKCPRCELNYVRDGEEYCEVCRRELRRAQSHGRHVEEIDGDEVVMCSECGEAPAVHGGELCAACLRERKRQVELEEASDLDDDESFDEDEDLEDDAEEPEDDE